MKAQPKIPKPRKAGIRRHEADREKRQELARLRHESNSKKLAQRKHRHQQANQERLKGKGLFYCDSPMARDREIQRRLGEANRGIPLQ